LERRQQVDAHQVFDETPLARAWSGEAGRKRDWGEARGRLKDVEGRLVAHTVEGVFFKLSACHWPSRH
jgi:hypothetical protein